MTMKHSRQRDAIWNFIKDSTEHPDAETVYLGVRESYPNISIGTVYRNLMLLTKIGRLRIVDIGDSVLHFDPNLTEHDHFICKKCGRILDLDTGSDHAQIRRRAAGNFGGRIEGYSAYFYGICEKCLQSDGSTR